MNFTHRRGVPRLRGDGEVSNFESVIEKLHDKTRSQCEPRKLHAVSSLASDPPTCAFAGQKDGSLMFFKDWTTMYIDIDSDIAIRCRNVHVKPPMSNTRIGHLLKVMLMTVSGLCRNGNGA